VAGWQGIVGRRISTVHFFIFIFPLPILPILPLIQQKQKLPLPTSSIFLLNISEDMGYNLNKSTEMCSWKLFNACIHLSGNP
jgi:hypothetical protein